MKRFLALILLLGLTMSMAGCEIGMEHTGGGDDGIYRPGKKEESTVTSRPPDGKPTGEIHERLIRYNEIVEKVCRNTREFSDYDEWKTYRDSAAVKYCYDFLMNAEDLDPWIGSEYVQKNWDDPEFLMMDRQTLLNKFTIMEDALLGFEVSYTDSLGNRNTEEGVYQYRLDGTSQLEFYYDGQDVLLEGLTPYAVQSCQLSHQTESTYDDRGNVTRIRYYGRLYDSDSYQDDYTFCIVEYTYNEDDTVNTIHYLDCNDFEYTAKYTYTNGLVTQASGLYCPHCHFVKDVTYSYDEKDRCIEVDAGELKICYEYNKDDTLRGATVFELDRLTYEFAYTYDMQGKLTRHQVRHWTYEGLYGETATEAPMHTVNYLYGDYYLYPPQTHFED